MRLTGVRSPEEDDVGRFRLFVARGTAPSPKDRRQTDDARSVSRSVAAVDVIVSERDARELLREEVHLVARLRAAEDPDGVRAAGREVSAKPFGRAIERFVPSCWTERAILANEWLREADVRAGTLTLLHAIFPGECLE